MNKCSVYVIAHVMNGRPRAPIKVGISVDPQRRMAGLQTANPKPLTLFAIFTADSRTVAGEIERAFHDEHADRRLSGEWFDVEPARAVRMLCRQFDELLTRQSWDSADELVDKWHEVGIAENLERIADAGVANDNAREAPCQ